MQQQPHGLPAGVDLEKPSPARCYDFYLGGAHNFEVDRNLARQVVDAVPRVRDIARDNRAFLRRAVTYCLANGITQFLDLGSGIPTAGNVHEIVHASNPDARVVYVDSDSVAVAHSETMLAETPNATAIQADMLDVPAVLEHPETQRLLDFSQPVAVMMVAVFHFVPDEERPREVIGRYFRRLATGSLLVFSHGTAEDYPEDVREVVSLYENGSTPLTTRSRAEVAELVSDFEPVEPGIVHAPEWHPDDPADVAVEDPAKSLVYSVVGRKVSL